MEVPNPGFRQSSCSQAYLKMMNEGREEEKKETKESSKKDEKVWGEHRM